MYKLAVLLNLALAAIAAPTDLSTRAGAPFRLPIHPAGGFVDSQVCVGIVGGIFASGTKVDTYTCNNSLGQAWQWNGGSFNETEGRFYNQTVSVTPVDDSNHYCLDAGNVNEIKNGVQLKVWECFPGLPQQTWTHLPNGQIKLTGVGTSVDGKEFCVDLTNASKANRNILQIWHCTDGNANQIWDVPTSP